MDALGIETAGDAVAWCMGLIALVVIGGLVLAYIIDRWRHEADEAEHESLMRDVARAQYRRDRSELIKAHLAE